MAVKGGGGLGWRGGSPPSASWEFDMRRPGGSPGTKGVSLFYLYSVFIFRTSSVFDFIILFVFCMA